MRHLQRFGAAALLAVGLVLPVPGAWAAAPQQTYSSECGSCHIPYPAAFLPSASWDQLLGHLDKHFGDNAELSKETRAQIAGYLDTHSYDNSRIHQRYGSRFDTPGMPLRVSETRLFQAMHHEVSDRWVSSNPKVKSFSHCDACHAGAAQGNFDEDEVRIPR